jgi:hypothetical protein
VTRWPAPILVLQRRRFATRSPGRVLHCCQFSFNSRVFLDSVHSHAAVEIHSVDTNRRVVLDAQIDVFADTETEVASLRKVALPQLVLLDLEATLQDLLCLGSPDCNVHGDLLVTTDTECSDGITGLACVQSVRLACVL